MEIFSMKKNPFLFHFKESYFVILSVDIHKNVLIKKNRNCCNIYFYKVFGYLDFGTIEIFLLSAQVLLNTSFLDNSMMNLNKRQFEKNSLCVFLYTI